MGKKSFQAVYYPKQIKVEITTRCNMFCPYCRRTQTKIKPEDIRIEAFEKIANQLLPKAKSIFLTGLGEPLLHPKIENIFFCIENIKRANPALFAFFATNGTFLDRPNIIRSILKTPFNEIIVSLDATKSATFQKLRPGWEFESILNNIKIFATEKRRLNKDIRLSLSFTFNAINAFEATDLPLLANELGCDRIIIQNMMVHDPTFVLDSNIMNLKEYEDETKRIFLDVSNKSKKYKIDCILPIGDWVKITREAPSKILKERYLNGSICKIPWEVLHFRLNGKISSCIGTEFLRVNLDKIENLYTEIWLSKEYQQIRKNIIDGQLDDHCLNCAILNLIPFKKN